MTTKTIMIPATIKFDGRRCDINCPQMGTDCGFFEICAAFDVRLDRYKRSKSNILYDIKRCRRCIEKGGLE